jgi:hypothetical protein
MNTAALLLILVKTLLNLAHRRFPAVHTTDNQPYSFDPRLLR